MKYFIFLAMLTFSFSVWSSEWNTDIVGEEEEYDFRNLKLISCTYPSQKLEISEATDEETIIAFGKLLGNAVWQETDYDVQEIEGKKYITTGEQFFTFIEVTACPTLQVKVFYN